MADWTMPPTRADLFAWLGGVDNGTPGDVVDLALAVAISTQAAAIDPTVPYDADLHAACLRRAARVLAAQPQALGAFTGGEFGVSFIPRWDAETDKYEANARRGGFA